MSSHPTLVIALLTGLSCLSMGCGSTIQGVLISDGAVLSRCDVYVNVFAEHQIDNCQPITKELLLSCPILPSSSLRSRQQPPHHP